MHRVLTFIVLFISHPVLASAIEKIELLPAAAYDRSSIYLNLALFWCGIIGLVVLLRMGLKEAGRLQRLDRKKPPEDDVPILE